MPAVADHLDLQSRGRRPVRGLLASAFLIAACGGEPDTRASTIPVARESAAAPAPVDSSFAESGESAEAIVARFRGQVPASALVRRGACPFECCMYREWTALQPIVIRRQPRDPAAAGFTLQPGEAFHADSGTVYVTAPMVVTVKTAVGDAGYWSFSPGDTLVVLDYVGEGQYNVWHDGRVQAVEGFWDPGRRPAVADRIGTWESEWWVHVTREDGRTGWFLVDRPRMFAGADACG